jgi:hypothetical protein
MVTFTYNEEISNSNIQAYADGIAVTRLCNIWNNDYPIWTYLFKDKMYQQPTLELLKLRFEEHITYEFRIKALEDQIQLAIGFKYIMPITSKIASIEILKYPQRDLSVMWAIVSTGSTLNKTHDWEYQSFPSSRTDEYLRLNRYESYADAVAMLNKHFVEYPTGYKDE